MPARAGDLERGGETVREKSVRKRVKRGQNTLKMQKQSDFTPLPFFRIFHLPFCFPGKGTRKRKIRPEEGFDNIPGGDYITNGFLEINNPGGALWRTR
jgi:hypothetical protein